MLLLPTPSGPVEFFVPQIDYELNLILISDPENCLTKKLLKLNSSSFLPYRFYSESKEKISFFNCSSVRKQHLRNLDLVNQNSQDMTTCPIYASSSDESVIELDLESCTKMFDVSRNFSAMDLRSNQLSLSWPIPNCTVCSAKGKKCRWKNNATKGGGGGDIECFVCNVERKTIQISKSVIFATAGSILLGLVTIALVKIYLHFREKEEDRVRIDKFLEDYRAQKPARFSYADIKRITSGFKEKLGEGAHGTVFKGKL
jgi:hypothetical protein